jgi:hypothetical protein
VAVKLGRRDVRMLLAEKEKVKSKKKPARKKATKKHKRNK